MTICISNSKPKKLIIAQRSDMYCKKPKEEKKMEKTIICQTPKQRNFLLRRVAIRTAQSLKGKKIREDSDNLYF